MAKQMVDSGFEAGIYEEYSEFRPFPPEVGRRIGLWLHEMLTNRLGIERKVRVADVGAGFGHFSLKIIEPLIDRLVHEGREVEVLCVDRLSDRLKVYEEHVAERHRERFEFVSKDITEVDAVGSEWADLILGIWLFNYCDNVDEVLVRLRQWIKRNGLFVYPTATKDLPEILLEREPSDCTSNFFAEIRELVEWDGADLGGIPTSDIGSIIRHIDESFGDVFRHNRVFSWADPLREKDYLRAFRSGTYATYQVIEEERRREVARIVMERETLWDLDAASLSVGWNVFAVGPQLNPEKCLPVSGDRESVEVALHDAFGISSNVGVSGVRLCRASTVAYETEGVGSVECLSPLYVGGHRDRASLIARFILYIGLLERVQPRRGSERANRISLAGLVASRGEEVRRLRLVLEHKQSQNVDLIWGSESGELVLRVPEPSVEQKVLLLQWLRIWSDEAPVEMVRHQVPEEVIEEPRLQAGLSNIVGELEELLKSEVDVVEPIGDSVEDFFVEDIDIKALVFLLRAWAVTHYRRAGSYGTVIDFDWKRSEDLSEALVTYATFSKAISPNVIDLQMWRARKAILAFLEWESVFKRCERRRLRTEASGEAATVASIIGRSGYSGARREGGEAGGEDTGGDRLVAKQLLKGGTKAIPVLGPVLEEAIWGTLEEKEAAEAQQEIYSVLDDIRRKLDRQEQTTQVVIQELSHVVSEEIMRYVDELDQYLSNEEADPPPWLRDRGTLRRLERWLETGSSEQRSTGSDSGGDGDPIKDRIDTVLAVGRLSDEELQYLAAAADVADCIERGTTPNHVGFQIMRAVEERDGNLAKLRVILNRIHNENEENGE